MRPRSRTELTEYILRQLGAPVLEINVAEEQVQDCIDDALQFWQERHYDGVAQVFLKYQITEDDVKRGLAIPPVTPDKGLGSVGIVTTSATTNIVGTAVTFNYYENSNYLQIDPGIIGINKIFQFDSAQSLSMTNMFSFKYQMFLNDLYYWGTTDLLSYSMAMSYLETMNFLLNTHKQIRFNMRQDRLYLDIDWTTILPGQYIIIDCWRQMSGDEYSRVWNDSFLKPYATALVKRQWGMNLIKFQGVKLPGGIEFNGRQIYDDAQREIDRLKEIMPFTYELPPLDLIG